MREYALHLRAQQVFVMGADNALHVFGDEVVTMAARRSILMPSRLRPFIMRKMGSTMPMRHTKRKIFRMPMLPRSAPPKSTSRLPLPSKERSFLKLAHLRQ